MSFLTCRCDFPQKEQRSCSLESVGRAISGGSVLRDDPVDDSVLLGLLRGHEVVALGVLADLLDRLARVLGDDLVELLAQLDDLAGVDLDVGGLALESRGDLVDQDLRVGQRHALALRAAGEEQRAHRHRDADADRLHVGLDELHRVVDREARVHRAAGRVDVDRDVLVGVLRLEVQQLRYDEVRDLVVHRRAEEDDALVEQARVDVEGAFATRRLLNDHRYEWAHGPRFGSAGGGGILPPRMFERINGPGPGDGVPAPARRGYEPGVQSLPDAGWAAALSASSPASSGGSSTGFASSARSSAARRVARSCLNASRRFADFSCSSSFLGLTPSCSAACSSSSRTSSSVGSMPSASTTAARTASRLSAFSASGIASWTISSSGRPAICRYISFETP